MNVFYTALIFCVICCAYASESAIGLVEQGMSSVSLEDPIASSYEAQRFREAVQSNDIDVASNIFSQGNDEQRNYCVKHMIGLGSYRLVNLINYTREFYKQWILRVLLVHADQQLLDKVFSSLKPSADLLARVSGSADLACLPQRFIYLISKIDDKEGQRWIVEKGVHALVHANKAACFDSLLSALEDDISLSTDLVDIAIRNVFITASGYQDSRTFYAKRFFGHPTISTDDYSGALYRSYDYWGQTGGLFHWLLMEADLQDLRVVKKNDGFYRKPPDFQDAVNQALQAVGPDSRPGITHQRRVAAMKEALDENIPAILLTLIGDYIEW